MQSFVNTGPQLLLEKCTWANKQLHVEDIAGETSLTSHSPLAVISQGGPLARAALAHVQQHYASDIARAEAAGLSAIVDVRVHRLMPGQFGAIPGWHCDGVPRNNYHGQPCFELINPLAFSVVGHVSSEVGGVSNTQFVTDNVKPRIWDDEHVFRDLHDWVEKKQPHTFTAYDGQFVRITPKTIHRAMPAHRRGWRFWFRFTMYHRPPITNVVNAPQQIYVVSENNGW